MRGRVSDLHYEYCAPKPTYKFKLWDSQREPYPDNETEEAQAEIASIDIYVNLVV
jgi:hypothetical protein